MFEIKIDQFTGPLDLLLKLIENRKLEISKIALSQVTGDYLDYLSNHQISIQELSDFLLVAAKLILIKSRSLLPEIKVEDEEDFDLESKLLEFKKIKESVLFLKKSLKSRQPLFPRNADYPTVFMPSKNVDARALKAAIEKLFTSLNIEIKQTLVVKKLIKLDEAITKLLKNFEGLKELKFSALIGRFSRSEIITYFLALLHLLRENILIVEQSKDFGEILIRKNGAQ